jgi:hypothetical protein
VPCGSHGVDAELTGENVRAPGVDSHLRKDDGRLVQLANTLRMQGDVDVEQFPHLV